MLIFNYKRLQFEKKNLLFLPFWAKHLKKLNFVPDQIGPLPHERRPVAPAPGGRTGQRAALAAGCFEASATRPFVFNSVSLSALFLSIQ
jgi:hypothetical protein